MKTKNTLLIIFLLATNFLLGQTVTVKADNYKHIFEGGGTSIGLYIGHHFSMSSANEAKAIKLINEDCNMAYLQDYTNETPAEKPAAYDKPSQYFLAGKAVRPEQKVSIVTNRYPTSLTIEETHNGKTEVVLDVNRAGIYDELAAYYFEILKGFKEKGVDVDIYSIANEPDFNKRYRYGYANPREGLSQILKQAIPKLKEMINDPSINTLGITIPRIMAPSTLSTTACQNYVDYFKANHPDAWNQIDIVATHQYGGALNTGVISSINNKLDGKDFFQSEQHADHSDYLGIGSVIERPHRASLNMSAIFAAAVNNGVQSWFYFENNYPQAYHSGGLIRVPWGGAPVPYKQYYTFKQLTSSQPSHSNVIERTISNFNRNEVIAFRKAGENVVYVNLSNFSASPKEAVLDFEGTNLNYGIKSVQVTTTNEFLNAEKSLDITLESSQNKFLAELTPFSTNTYKVTLDLTGATNILQEQTVTFTNIEDKNFGDVFNLNATSTSGLPISYEILEGSAELNGTELTCSGIGTVTIKAFQEGDETYLKSRSVIQSFIVLPNDDKNLALNKPVSVDSELNAGNSAFAVDGDNTNNSSRWVTTNTEFPHWIEIDLQGTYSIDAFAFWTGYNGYNRPINAFQFQIWDGEKWVDVKEETDNDNPIYLSSITPVTTTKVRLYMTAATDNYVRLFELAVYGSDVLSTNNYNKKNFKIFPNPVNDILNVEAIDNVEKITIYNLYGKEVIKTSNVKLIDVSFLSKGLYIIQVDNAVTKFIKK